MKGRHVASSTCSAQGLRLGECKEDVLDLPGKSWVPENSERLACGELQ